MSVCDNCAQHISERFKRVFSDETGRVRACPGCATKAGIAQSSRERSSGG
ncbi:DUF7563 family protein [Haloferax sp. Atlit-48N]